MAREDDVSHESELFSAGNFTALVYHRPVAPLPRAVSTMKRMHCFASGEVCEGAMPGVGGNCGRRVTSNYN